MKRLFDLAAASLGLIVLSPVLGATALLVRKNLGSPVIFKQQRIGQYGEPFEIYKFRSMTDESDGSGNLKSDDERLTDTGVFIRKYSLDELPQLINVIKGDLSLVGPRPLLMQYLKLFNREQMKRHMIKPGITGWAQVNGRNELSWQQKFAMDVWYVENRSIFLDIKILYVTLKNMLKNENVNGKDGKMVDYFTGNQEVCYEISTFSRKEKMGGNGSGNIA